MNSSILNLLPWSKGHHPVLLGLVLLVGLWADAQRFALAGTGSLGTAGVTDASQTTGLADRSGWEWLLEPNACFQSEPEETFTLPLPDAPKSVMQRPLLFERNQGQTAEEVAFLSRGRGYTLFLTGTEAVMQLQEPSGRGHNQEERLARGGERAGVVPENPARREGKVMEQPGEPRVLRMRLAGASPDAPVSGEEPQRARAHYFIGNDASRWRTNIPMFGRVRFDEVYAGIDLVYYGNEGRLEYDFVVAPGADPNQIALEFDGAEGLKVDQDGDLVLDLGGREVRWQKPLIYQEVNGRRVEIPGRYRVRPAATAPVSLVAATHEVSPVRAVPSVQWVSFELAAYDRGLPLVIDPILIYSTYLGGSGAEGDGSVVGLDQAGNVYVAGATTSIDFPTESALNPQHAGGESDIFVTKFSPGGDLLFSTYLGGSGDDGRDHKAHLAISPEGECYVVGMTASGDFPLVNPLQGSFGGGNWDVFVTSLKLDGSALLFSTYLGGEGKDTARSVALGPAGDIYVVGLTDSVGFPTKNAFQPELSPPSDGFQLQDSFITRLEAGGRSLLYSTYYGLSTTSEQASGVTVDGDGNIYVAIWVRAKDGASQWLISKITPDGSTRLFERRWPATSSTQGVSLPRIALGPSNNVVVAGSVTAANLQARNRPSATTPQGASEGYIGVFSATNGSYVTATYFGSNGGEDVSGLSTNATGGIILVGSTWSYGDPGAQSTNFPVLNPLPMGPDPGLSPDVFVAQFRLSDLSLTFSTLLGGPGNEISAGMALDPRGDLWIVGRTSGQFPVVNAFQEQPGGGDDSFLAKVSLRDARLQISRSGEDVSLSWPAETADLVLESTTSLPAVSWEVVTNTPTINGTERSVQLPLTGSATFFRLRKP